MGIRTAQVKRDIHVNSHRMRRRKRRNVTASRPILSSNSGSFVRNRGGNQPNIESDIRGGGLSPSWYFTFGS